MNIENYGYIYGVDFVDEQSLEIVRMIRNKLLLESDWTQLQDAPLTEEERGEWIIYRQELRDITSTYQNNLLNTIFPNKP